VNLKQQLRFTLQVSELRGSLPIEVKLCMRIILLELIISLGWTTLVFNMFCSGPGCYICETYLFLGHEHASPRTRIVTIAGAVASSTEEALESSCKAAIFLMENKESIRLLDLNYSQRSN
jgi:hypothetical protein